MADESPYVRGVHLSRTDEHVREVAALRDLMGGTPGLAGLLGDLTQRARPALVPRLLGRAVTEAYSWDRHDARDPRWWPQGISTSADASDTELVDGRRLVVVAWYSRKVAGIGHGARATFLDLESLRYRHVLLVVPRLDDGGRLTLEPLHVHAGGIVWAGDHLHVAATSRGFVTARVDDIARVGDHYVLPVRFRYRAHTDEGHTALRYSFLSLDRGADPPVLLAGEYGRGGQTTRLARYALDPATWLPAVGEDGLSRPLSLDEDGPRQMQGAVVAGGRHHLTASRGPWLPGTVYAGRPGAFREHRLATPMGPEDLAWWPSTDRLWSVTEHPRRRWVFAMRRSWFD